MAVRRLQEDTGAVSMSLSARAAAVIATVTLVASGCAPAPAETTTITAPVTVTATATDPGASAPTETTPATADPTPPQTQPTDLFAFGDEWLLADEDEAQGTGCAPGGGDLPDGVWFGFVESWSTSKVKFDLACFWVGTGAEREMLDDGYDADGVLDFYITNDVATIRTVPVAGDVPALKAGWEDGTFTLSAVIADPGGSLPTAEPYPAWLYVNGGEVTALAVQYLP